MFKNDISDNLTLYLNKNNYIVIEQFIKDLMEDYLITLKKQMYLTILNSPPKTIIRELKSIIDFNNFVSFYFDNNDFDLNKFIINNKSTLKFQEILNNNLEYPTYKSYHYIII